jgi:hypothetical protein
MAILHFTNTSTLQEVLTDPSIVQLLRFLTTDVVCFSTAQISDFLSHFKPQEMPTHEFHKLVRSLLHRIETEGYLKSKTVERVPAVTIGSAPLFRLNLIDAASPSAGGFLEDPPTVEELAAIDFGDGKEFRKARFYSSDGTISFDSSSILTTAQLSQLADVTVHAMGNRDGVGCCWM